LPSLRHIDFSPEFRFQTSRSSGAGGQNVNKVETRVALIFNVRDSMLLDDIQKERISQKLSNRIDSGGFLQVTAEKFRSQLKNKELAIEKFYELLEKALTVQKQRRPTRPGKAAVQKRLTAKKILSQKKQDRKFGED
jgi:ribosome-associated protein